MIDSPAVEWGVTINRVETKDVSPPETMKRSMARQAEDGRERRARVISVDAELQASRKSAEAAQQMADIPGHSGRWRSGRRPGSRPPPELGARNRRATGGGAA